jgi:alpha-tubulin suppressor-like RCC1 family protein
MEIRTEYKIADVRCGEQHTCALTECGKVLTWGNGGGGGTSGYGRLGHGSTKDLKAPTLVEALAKETIVSIGVGESNTGAINERGQLFVWGAGSKGQCGQNDFLPQMLPKVVPLPKGVKGCAAISFGRAHTALITPEGKLYVFGDNSFGQLGLGDASADTSKFPTPQLVEALSSQFVIQAECGDSVTLALTKDGTVFGFGASETSQLCTNDEYMADMYTPHRIPFPFNEEHKALKANQIRQLSVSELNCAAVANNGSIYVWGYHLGESVHTIKPCIKLEARADMIEVGHEAMLIST